MSDKEDLNLGEYMTNAALCKEILNKLTQVANEVGLEPDQLALSAGAALAIHGVRKHYDDLDISIDTKLFDAIKKKNSYPYKVVYNDIEIISVYPWADLHRLDAGTELVKAHGVVTFSIPELIKQKKTLLTLPGRAIHKLQQDRLDIIALEKLLA